MSATGGRFLLRGTGLFYAKYPASGLFGAFWSFLRFFSTAGDYSPCLSPNHRFLFCLPLKVSPTPLFPQQNKAGWSGFFIPPILSCHRLHRASRIAVLLPEIGFFPSRDSSFSIDSMLELEAVFPPPHVDFGTSPPFFRCCVLLNFCAEVGTRFFLWRYVPSSAQGPRPSSSGPPLSAPFFCCTANQAGTLGPPPLPCN